jgi:hypothetical protein
MKQEFSGGCHCGAVRYQVAIDLSQGTFRCNCSLCSKARAWFTSVSPTEFRLLRGQTELCQYSWVPPGKSAANLTYHFCSRCGIRVFASGRGLDGEAMIGLNVPTLEDAPADDLAASLRYLDGAADRFDREPADTRLL